MTDEEVIAQTNALARTFYRQLGYVTPEGYRFDKARHPQEKLCWQMACEAQIQLRETDPDEALSNVEE